MSALEHVNPRHANVASGSWCASCGKRRPHLDDQDFLESPCVVVAGQKSVDCICVYDTNGRQANSFCTAFHNTPAYRALLDPGPIKPDPVNPSHYHGTKVDEFIEEFKLGFRLGNAVKYIARHQDKDRLQDLKKALWYLKREISRLENP